MNQELFLQELSKALQPLSEEERNEVLFDFEEHITEGMKEGRLEADIIRELGSPKQIAKELVPDVTETAPALQRPKKNLFHMVCSAAAVSILNLIFVLGPAIGIVCGSMRGGACTFCVTDYVCRHSNVSNEYAHDAGVLFIARIWQSGAAILYRALVFRQAAV
ncbi:DUF1700 domain-containing protein [Bacillus sp. N12A5]|uniref:DUF1700 domain-containing protein n=1 Tax=Bacillus sp. N12A5 TaxID=2918908 RepID=UPI003B01F184